MTRSEVASNKHGLRRGAEAAAGVVLITTNEIRLQETRNETGLRRGAVAVAGRPLRSSGRGIRTFSRSDRHQQNAQKRGTRRPRSPLNASSTVISRGHTESITKSPRTDRILKKSRTEDVRPDPPRMPSHHYQGPYPVCHIHSAPRGLSAKRRLAPDRRSATRHKLNTHACTTARRQKLERQIASPPNSCQLCRRADIRVETPFRATHTHSPQKLHWRERRQCWCWKRD
ncbi:hypothetical protein IW262DRAFT_1045522 [Armillaria fumosa]|nr:hypothetical protein IW262DRAFT_1045522 [Armillaria fumosa]